MSVRSGVRSAWQLACRAPWPVAVRGSRVSRTAPSTTIVRGLPEPDGMWHVRCASLFLSCPVMVRSRGVVTRGENGLRPTAGRICRPNQRRRRRSRQPRRSWPSRPTTVESSLARCRQFRPGCKKRPNQSRRMTLSPPTARLRQRRQRRRKKSARRRRVRSCGTYPCPK